MLFVFEAGMRERREKDREEAGHLLRAAAQTDKKPPAAQEKAQQNKGSKETRTPNISVSPALLATIEKQHELALKGFKEQPPMEEGISDDRRIDQLKGAVQIDMSRAHSDGFIEIKAPLNATPAMVREVLQSLVLSEPLMGDHEAHYDESRSHLMDSRKKGNDIIHKIPVRLVKTGAEIDQTEPTTTPKIDLALYEPNVMFGPDVVVLICGGTFIDIDKKTMSRLMEFYESSENPSQALSLARSYHADGLEQKMKEAQGRSSVQPMAPTDTSTGLFTTFAITFQKAANSENPNSSADKILEELFQGLPKDQIEIIKKAYHEVTGATGFQTEAKKFLDLGAPAPAESMNSNKMLETIMLQKMMQAKEQDVLFIITGFALIVGDWLTSALDRFAPAKIARKHDEKDKENEKQIQDSRDFANKYKGDLKIDPAFMQLHSELMRIALKKGEDGTE